jgi:hypothetical protein
VHLQVDAALIAQLRSGYAELGALRSSGAKVIGAPFVANVADTPRGVCPPVPPLPLDNAQAPQRNRPLPESTMKRRGRLAGGNWLKF